jgi:hypothetical protein
VRSYITHAQRMQARVGRPWAGGLVLTGTPRQVACAHARAVCVWCTVCLCGVCAEARVWCAVCGVRVRRVCVRCVLV